MPPDREQDLLLQADIAIDRFELAKTTRNPAEIARARTALERIRSDLEKLRDAAKTIDVMKLALSRPIDAATGKIMAKTAPTPGRKTVDHPTDRFDKLQRPSALAK